MTDIPLNFCNDKHEPVLCDTVAEVIEQLKRLPPDLPVNQGFGEGVRIIVYNVSTNPHVEFEDADE